MIGGMDEAGRGPAIGPIVFGLVIATKSQLKKLDELGIDDSKKLSKKKRIKFVEIIQKNVNYFDTLVVSASEIDYARNKEEITMNELEVASFRKLLQPFKDKISMLQLDAADVNAERFGNNFSDMIDGEIDSRHKGDSIFTSVGAASILAKERRDSIVEQLQQEMIGTDPDLPSFGSGYPAQAKPFLEAYVKKYNALPDIARSSWKTSQNALEIYSAKQSDLSTFFE